MKPVRLALSLILVPRLFLTLILFPLILSIILIYLQLFVTTILVSLSNRDSVKMEKKISETQNDNLLRRILYGDGKPLRDFKICKWTSDTPPEPDCNLNRLDAAVHAGELTDAELARYADIFRGNVRKLHICKDCKPDIVLIHSPEKVTCNIFSIWGLMLARLAMTTSDAGEHMVQAFKQTEDVSRLLGEQFLHIYGLSEAIKINEVEPDLVFIINIAGMLIIAVWLALKAHKKVLDYFSKSGALLPLVAATGKETFYQALWIITAIRVSAFLLTALPITIFTLHEIYSENISARIFNYEPLLILVWFITIILALSFATLIASIADLKQRYTLFGIFYKFLPITVCLLGSFIWSLTFLLDGTSVNNIRLAITSLPVLGVGPVLLSPIVKPGVSYLIIHSILTIFLFKILLSKNSRWFAAHLDDL
jgi:hypothetical protein